MSHSLSLALLPTTEYFYSDIPYLFGLGPILTREGARKESTLEQYLRTILGTKIILSVLALVALVISIFGLTALGAVPLDTRSLVLLGGVIIIFDTFTFTFWSVFRAKQQMKWEAIGVVIYQLLIVTAGSIALFLGAPLIIVVSAVLLGSIFHFIFSLSTLKRKTDLRLRPQFNKNLAKRLLKISAPFALAGI